MFVGAEEQFSGATVYVSLNGKYIGYVGVGDSVKENGKISFEKMRKRGIKKIYVISGDKQSKVDMVASMLYADGAYSQLLPEHKLDALEDIIENGIVSGMKPTDVQKILNLKHAWEFILDKDVLSYGTDYHILCHIAKLVNEGFYSDGGRIRGVPVTIGGTSYIPPLPIESIVKENIDAIISESDDAVDTAIQLCLYCMKTQIFNDGNKRAAVIFANHYMITKGQGLLVIPQEHVPKFKRLLVAYYEDRDNGEITEFMRTLCWRTF